MTVPFPIDAHLCRLGDHGIAWQPPTRTIALLNPAAAQVCQREGEAAGVLAEAFGSGAVACAEAETPAPQSEPRLEITIRLHRRVVAVRGWLPNGNKRILARVMHRATAEAAEVVLELHPGRDGLGLWRDGVRLAWAPKVDLLAGYVYEELLAADREPDRLLCFLHAAALEWKGRTLLLCGSSGSGKTTLSAAMALRGGVYLGDELAGLAEDGLTVHALPTGLAVKPAGSEAIEELFRESGIRRPPELGERLWHLDIGGLARTADSASRPSVLLFPRFDRNAEPRVERLDVVDAAGRLVTAGVSLDPCGTAETLRRFVQVVSETPAYELFYRDARKAVDEIDAIVQAL
jgi:hypothetical protein